MARSRSPQFPLIFTGCTLLSWFYLIDFFLIRLGVWLLQRSHWRSVLGAVVRSGGTLSLMVYEFFKVRWRIETKISKRTEVIAYWGEGNSNCVKVVRWLCGDENKQNEKKRNEGRQVLQNGLGITVLWMNNKNTKCITDASFIQWLVFNAWMLAADWSF